MRHGSWKLQKSCLNFANRKKNQFEWACNFFLISRLNRCIHSLMSANIAQDLFMISIGDGPNCVFNSHLVCISFLSIFKKSCTKLGSQTGIEPAYSQQNVAFNSELTFSFLHQGFNWKLGRINDSREFPQWGKKKKEIVKRVLVLSMPIEESYPIGTRQLIQFCGLITCDFSGLKPSRWNSFMTM